MIRTLLILMLFSCATLADDGSDRIRTSDGASCESSVNTGKRMYAELYADDSDYNGEYDYGYNNYNVDEIGVKLGFEIELGQTSRVDCQHLYDLELRDRRIDLKLKEAELEMKLLSIQEAKHRLSERKRDF